ncbi:hypothetical protein MPER_03150, partial [Moniliophthora perniciosa FA553]
DILIRRRGPITSFAFCPYNEQIACGTDLGSIFVRDVQSGVKVNMRTNDEIEWDHSEHSARVFSIAFSPDRKKIVSSSSDRTTRIWDAVTGARLGVYRLAEDTISSICAFSGDATIATIISLGERGIGCKAQIVTRTGPRSFSRFLWDKISSISIDFMDRLGTHAPQASR